MRQLYIIFSIILMIVLASCSVQEANEVTEEQTPQVIELTDQFFFRYLDYIQKRNI